MMQTTPELRTLAKQIKLAVFDVDGVLTNGGLYLGENGNEYKRFNAHDGLGMVMLRNSGCQLAVITARTSSIVTDRMLSLGVEHVYQGQNDKGTALRDLARKLALELSEILYVGDDLIDLPAMIEVGFPVAVADAHPLVKKNCLFVTESLGGRGAVREVCEFVLSAQGTLQEQYDQFLGKITSSKLGNRRGI